MAYRCRSRCVPSNLTRPPVTVVDADVAHTPSRDGKMVNDGYCPACGIVRQPGMRFCGKCGYDFGLTPDTAPAAAAVAYEAAVSTATVSAVAGPVGWAATR